ncbi:helix-turn-helix domain-containing protein [Pseudactinotalea suaedae]|uniref:helix-turn-helix domain-containing protein n=1 Tax=Pseudactinotalea suaedae TaxID=1524924 RepID=UPI0012E32609|nr:helix-turn-helix transcriptional regulator [Pseudactinotalea suaedae]
MDIGERASTLRRANGLSARQVAALVDVAPTTVTRMESGAVSPSFDLAQEILTVLGSRSASPVCQMPRRSPQRGRPSIRRLLSR